MIKLNIGTKGGRIQSVELKDYKTFDHKPLILWDKNNSDWGLSFYANNRDVYTREMVFTYEQINSQTLSFKAKTSEGYIEFLYHLPQDSYMLDLKINLINLNKSIANNTRTINLSWNAKIIGQEKGRSFENQNTTLYIKHFEDDVDRISSEKKIPTRLKWIGFKQQFFSSVLIFDKGIKGVSVFSNDIKDEKSNYLKEFSADIPLPYRNTGNENYGMQFYFGPNHFLTLREYGKDIELHRLINLGWWIFGWVNRYLVIPIFNFLENNIVQNYGIIILLLTLIIKLLLFPLTYKSYASQAKMRVLKPQIDEITKKFPKEKMMERQRATMDMYRKAGVNPMGGCLPMFIQLPILYAMFRFFPASIELRQKSFLWAEDLSTYDSIASLPFDIPMYGAHISLFCLLMAITNLAYTHFNMQLTAGTSQQMPGMKLMMYLMPVMLLVWFNNYSSGLSYYYFISTLITVLQTVIIRKTIDDKKVLAKLEAKKKKPRKKSGFQGRLEKMARERGYKLPKK